MELQEALEKSNPFWREGRVRREFCPPTQRKALAEIIGLLKYNRIVRIIGPRRTGKTTLMHQTMQHLIDSGVKPESILFFSVDDPLFGFEKDVIGRVLEEYYDNVLKKSPSKQESFVFIDEIQKADGWSLWLKSYFEKKYKAKFVVSGSSAARLKRGGKESLLGRMYDVFVAPLSFAEFLEFSSKTRSDELEVRRALDEYLLAGGYPEWFQVKSIPVWQNFLVQDVMKKAIYDDIASLYEVRNPAKLEELLYLIASLESQSLSTNTIAQSLKTDFETAEKYVSYLKEAFLVYERRFYSPSGEKVLKKNIKLDLSDSGMRNALLKEEKQTGLSIESAAAKHLHEAAARNNYALYYWKNGKEVDFVLKTAKKLLPIECKYQNAVGDADAKQLIAFCEKFKCTEGILITKTQKKRFTARGTTISFIPLHEFLLTEF